MLDRFHPRIENALDFARRSRVILITASNGYALDAAIMRRWLQAFAELLHNPEIVERFERPWRRIHSSGRAS